MSREASHGPSPLLALARFQRTGHRITPDAIAGYTVLRALHPESDAPVYLARRQADDLLVVIKVVDRSITESPALWALARWRAETVAALEHPQVVRVLANGHGESPPHVVFEYLRGGSLRARMGQARSRATRLGWFRQIVSSLAAVHAAGMVHMDVKPENLLFRDHETLVLIDFGMSVRMGAQPLVFAGNAQGGTPAYVSPEQAEGLAMDGRADLYACGILLHELLTGEAPFTAETPAQLLYKHLHDEVPLLPKAERDLQPLIDTLLAKSRDARPADAAAVLALLAPFMP